MNVFDPKQELSSFEKKTVEIQEAELIDIYKPFLEMSQSLKNFDKISKKNLIQSESLIESLKVENKRINAEISESKLFNQKTVKSLIQILDQVDDIQRFAESVNNENWARSIDLIQKKVKRYINDLGIYEIQSQGEIFNEEFHNCVETVKNPSIKKYQILNVMRKGYKLNGETIRPADVVVSIGEIE